MPQFHAHPQIGITHLFLVLTTQVGGLLQIERRNLLPDLILCKTLVLSLMILLFLGLLFFLSFLLQLLGEPGVYLDGLLDTQPVEQNNYGKVDCEVQTN